MKIQMDSMRPHDVKLCLYSHLDSVDDWLLAIAQLVNENKSQKTSSEKIVDFTLIRFMVHDLSSRLALDAKLIT